MPALSCKNSMEPRVLILAYGNPLRGDDGVAWRVAELLREQLSSDDAEIVCAHQLAPEFAEIVSRVGGVIFIDARENGEPGKIYQTVIDNAADPIYGTHVLTSAQLMMLCDVLYGCRPEAYEISVSGECFSHGEHLSFRLNSALPLIAEAAVKRVRQFTRERQKHCGSEMEVR